MTYKELYLKEHPDEADNFSAVVARDCPGDYFNNEEAPRIVEDTCSLWPLCVNCWDQKIPEGSTVSFKKKSDIQKTVEKLQECGIKEAGDSISKATNAMTELTSTVKSIEVKPEVEFTGVTVEPTKTGTAIKDSGNRREFSTGAVRDIQEGKGRCDLMPLDVIADYMEVDPNKRDWVLWCIEQYQQGGYEGALMHALSHFGEMRDWTAYTMMLEAAKHFEAGAAKYGEWNWQKGIPTHCYIDSAVRHYLKFLRGDKDEPHDRAFVWNILCCIWTCKHKPELNDYPRKEEKADE